MKLSTNKKERSYFNPFRLRQLSFSGILLGGLAFIACELPIILALVGLSGLGAGAMFLKPPFIVEIFAMLMLAAGIVMLAILVIKGRLMKSTNAK